MIDRLCSEGDIDSLFVVGPILIIAASQCIETNIQIRKQAISETLIKPNQECIMQVGQLYIDCAIDVIINNTLI